jgi:hypothetical protein
MKSLGFIFWTGMAVMAGGTARADEAVHSYTAGQQTFTLACQAEATATVDTCGTARVGFCVRVDGRVVEAQSGRGWRYVAASNSIVFGAELPAGAKIQVDYVKTASCVRAPVLAGTYGGGVVQLGR